MKATDDIVVVYFITRNWITSAKIFFQKTPHLSCMGWYRTKGHHALNDQAVSLYWCSLVSQLQSANNINKLCYSVEGKIDFNTKVTNPRFKIHSPCT